MTTETLIIAPKKLIEVALPLDAINIESLRRKQKAPKGWPTSFHKLWAQRPVAAARAVLFGQLVNDPSWKWELEHPGEIPPNSLKASWAASRNRLFRMMENLVLWDKSKDKELLASVYAEIQRSWRETCELNKSHPAAKELFNASRLPSICDPFAGSGTIPLEAQRMGLDAIASDLNPVAVLINKALIEIPQSFFGLRAINDASRQSENDLVGRHWEVAQGLAEDVYYYGQVLADTAYGFLGKNYPNVHVSLEAAQEQPELDKFIGKEIQPIAYIWARTVASPSPAFRNIQVPLISSFVLSQKSGGVYVKPKINGSTYSFDITRTSFKDASKGTKLSRGANFRCILSGAPISPEHVKAEGQAGRMGLRLVAVVATTGKGRIYLPPSKGQEEAALNITPEWIPDLTISGSGQYIGVRPYGINNFSQLFTKRQNAVLSKFSSLISVVKEKVFQDALRVGMADDGLSLQCGGTGATAYSEAIAMYLAIGVDRMAFYGSSLCGWLPKDNAMGKSMPQQALAMSWDFAEGNPFGKSSTEFMTCMKSVRDCLLALNGGGAGTAIQHDARSGLASNAPCVVSTDPPYFDNVPYADLSDFFYVWLRRSMREIFPSLFSTIASPKTGELVAFAHRHDEGKQGATEFFLQGMTDVMAALSRSAHPGFPITIYYAFKQSETDDSTGTVSSGWETFLEAVIRAGLSITGTWPMRTEGETRMRASESNALASSIVLVCRSREPSAKTVSRRAFLREINQVLPEALDEMTRGTGDERSQVAPVDLSQAIIGPGMAVFSKYAAVLEADGTPMSVRTALQLINRFLAEDDFDHDTQFCLHWFEQYGWKEGRFGEADTLARAKGTSVDGVRQAGVLFASGGVVRLLKWMDYPSDWDAEEDERLPIWEALHQLIRVFKSDGESAAGVVLAALAPKAEATRQLAYRLYTLCERAGWAEDARAYNEIVTSWSAIESVAAAAPKAQQTDLFQ